MTQGSDLVQSLLAMTLVGVDWILWLLLALSVLSIAIILERALFFWRMGSNYEAFNKNLLNLLKDGEKEKALTLCEEDSSLQAKIALQGLRNTNKGHGAMEHIMEGTTISLKQKLDRGLVILGTLGNNAPFIGLFGTVVGIIKSFHDLAINPQGGPSVVMTGISEALVATAVGLLVAIPAVIAFNTFSRLVKNHMSHSQVIMKLVLGFTQQN